MRLDPGAKPPEDKTDAFTVGFYDMPLQDNSRLGELTYSVLLKKTDPEKNEAEVIVMRSPESYTFRNPLIFDEILVRYMAETPGSRK